MKPYNQDWHKQESIILDALKTPLDFIRFGITSAAQAGLWYGHGTDNAWDEMMALILCSLNLTHDVNAMVLQARLTRSEKQYLFSQLKKRIIEKVPVAYLTHQAYFCGEAYYVDERVLIPRSPIAELIEQRFEPWVEASHVRRVLDLCTGSGCIAIACAYAFPEAWVDAVDISEDALDVARMNVTQHQMHEVVRVIQSDVWQHVPPVQYDIIVSNPPYVGHQECQTLPAEYHHEPRMALEADDNGLKIIRQIIERAGEVLSPQGILVVEVGNSEPALVEAYPHLPFTWLDFERGGQGVFLLTAEQLRGLE